MTGISTPNLPPPSPPRSSAFRPLPPRRLDDLAVRNRVAAELGIDLACFTRDGTGFAGVRRDLKSLQERWDVIGAMRAAGLSVRRIAVALGIRPSTVTMAARKNFRYDTGRIRAEEGDREFARGVARSLAIEWETTFARSGFGTLSRGVHADARRRLFVTLAACGWGESRIANACGLWHSTVRSALGGRRRKANAEDAVGAEGRGRAGRDGGGIQDSRFKRQESRAGPVVGRSSRTPLSGPPSSSPSPSEPSALLCSL